MEVEKEDPEFREALMGEIQEKTNEEIPEREIVISIETSEIPEERTKNIEKISEKTYEISPLTSTQEVLYDFIYKQLSQGKSIREAEKMLEKGISEGLYKEADVFLAVNYVLEKEMRKNSLNFVKVNNKVDVTDKSVIVAQPNAFTITAFVPEEQKLIDFLMRNPSHTNSTVELYNQIGLSSRKGNILKNKLLEKGIIKIQEERSTEGWKKIIQLTNSNHIH
jgi:hypothetical protein